MPALRWPSLCRSLWHLLDGSGGQRSLKLQEKQIKMQKRITQIEESRERDRVIQSRKANLRAELQKRRLTADYIDKFHIRPHDRRYDYCLTIINDGPKTARNVKAMLDGKPIMDHPAIASSQQEIGTIGPGLEISYIAAITNDCSPPFKFKVTWEDDSGEPGEYETTLTFS